MATIVNNPTPDRVVETSGSSGVGAVVGVIALILVLILFFVYGLPALRHSNSGGTTNINVTPSGGSANTSTGTGY